MTLGIPEEIYVKAAPVLYDLLKIQLDLQSYPDFKHISTDDFVRLLIDCIKEKSYAQE